MKLVTVKVITFLKPGGIIYPVLALTQESGYLVQGCNLDKLDEQSVFFKLEVPDNLDDELIVQIRKAMHFLFLEFKVRSTLNCTNV